MEQTEALIKIFELSKRKAWLRSPEPVRPRPQRLFHYTSPTGLLGIVASNVLWATNALYLNDSSELAYGLSVAHEQMRAMTTSNSVVREFLDGADKLLDLTILVPNHQFYACCFCEDPDLLSQWRAYSDRGGGYAIGFDVDDLGRAAVKRHLSLFPVDYGLGETSRLLAQDVKAVCDALDCCSKEFPRNDEIFISAASEALRLTLVFRVLSMKHPGFQEEREWRILANFEKANLRCLHFGRVKQPSCPTWS